jgi:hypothetical protein
VTIALVGCFVERYLARDDALSLEVTHVISALAARRLAEAAGWAAVMEREDLASS